MQSRSQTLLAREMRRVSTPAENRTWHALKALAKGRVAIRRQHPHRGFYLDFYCIAAKLALELDGASHDFKQEYDDWRTSLLEKDGIEVLRARNELADPGEVANLAEWFIAECERRIAARKEPGRAEG